MDLLILMEMQLQYCLETRSRAWCSSCSGGPRFNSCPGYRLICVLVLVFPTPSAQVSVEDLQLGNENFYISSGSSFTNNPVTRHYIGLILAI
jgi:hypothetical protein